MLCGFLGSDTPDDPVLSILPTVLKVNVAESASGGWIESSLRFAAAELTAGRVKSPTVLARLAELLFLEAVRQYVASLPPEQTGWSGVRDPLMGRALAVIQGRLAYRWTTEELAREVGMSRSAFADRFTRLMGEPPMRYLAQQRLQAAARRLERRRIPWRASRSRWATNPRRRSIGHSSASSACHRQAGARTGSDAPRSESRQRRTANSSRPFQGARPPSGLSCFDHRSGSPVMQSRSSSAIRSSMSTSVCPAMYSIQMPT
jgi:AraC-like DNA-binding protein